MDRVPPRADGQEGSQGPRDQAGGAESLSCGGTACGDERTGQGAQRHRAALGGRHRPVPPSRDTAG